LVPQYPPARAKVSEMFHMEATQRQALVSLKATEKWKDSGVVLQAGKPVTIRAAGTWTFKLTAQSGPQGLRIAEEYRDFDPGALVGMIVPNIVEDPKDIKPFMIGAEKQFLAPVSGKLMLQMYDNDLRDNEGEITVEITGTFQGGEEKKAIKPKE
jgi:hypothetical protein